MKNPLRIPSTNTPSGEGRIFTTTEGRQKFPDILQTSYGEKAVIGFGRYGRALGAVVPMEAVRLLAGFEGAVDEDIRARIQRTARSLLQDLPTEAKLCGLSDGSEGLVEIEDVEAARASRKVNKKQITRTAIR
jgi:hypothetical protein